MENGIDHKYNADFRVPLTITEGNVDQLRAAAETLRGEIKTTDDMHLRTALIQALFSMPAVQAAPVWEEVIKDGYGTEELLRIPSVQTADILAEFAWPSNDDQDASSSRRTGVPQLLIDMYQQTSSNVSLKRQIKTLFANHGTEFTGDKYSLMDSG